MKMKDLKAYALIGARTHVETILGMFPELGRELAEKFRKPAPTTNRGTKPDSKKLHTWTAARRKQHSQMMKKRWATRHAKGHRGRMRRGED